MSVILSFAGAAGTVTGSKFLLEHAGARLLVDAGLYQGERAWRRLNWQHSIGHPETLDDVVLTHTHLDHCGYLPALVRQGFHGPVWASAGTATSRRSPGVTKSRPSHRAMARAADISDSTARVEMPRSIYACSRVAAASRTA